MVDLQQALRPTGQDAPLPIREIAARARRRKHRRLASTTGLVVVTAGLLVLAINNLPHSTVDTATVADVADREPPDDSTGDGTTAIDPSSSPDPSSESATPTTATPTTGTPTTPASTSGAPSGGPTGSEETGPDPTGSTGAQPTTTPGIRTSTTITSEWEGGYCIQIEVSNDGGDLITWQVVLQLDGTIDTLWNATVVEPSTGTFAFSGQEGYNATIRPAATTGFGACLHTNGS